MRAMQPEKPGELWLYDDGVSRIILITVEIVPYSTRSNPPYRQWTCRSVGIPSVFHARLVFAKDVWEFPGPNIRLLLRAADV